MQDYLFTNLLLTLLCSLSLLVLKSAPARLKLYIALFAMICWYIPWHLMQFSTPQANSIQQALSFPTYEFLFAAECVNDCISTNTEFTSAFYEPWFNEQLLSFSALAFVLLLIGAGLLIKDHVKHFYQIKQWKKQSIEQATIWEDLGLTSQAIQVRFLSLPVAGMATGYFKPTIWLGQNLQGDAQIKTALLHELTHIRNRDPFFILLLASLQKLMWFNPILWCLHAYARKQLELSCDSQCASLFPPEEYKNQLIEIMLNKHQRSFHDAHLLGVNNQSSFNVHRIKTLSEDTNMKNRHFLILSFLITTALWISVSNATSKLDDVSSNSDSMKYAMSEADLNNALLMMSDKKFELAHQELLGVSKNMSSFSTDEQAYVWGNLVITCAAVNCSKQNLNGYADNLLKHKHQFSDEKNLISYLSMAHNVSYRNGDYAAADKYFYNIQNLGLPISDNLRFVQSIVKFKQGQSDLSAEILNDLVSNAEAHGQQIDESWLKMLVGTYIKSKNYNKALDAQAKLANTFPSAENDNFLLNLQNTLAAGVAKDIEVSMKDE